ncbi:sulfite exporter TauE/SafE family protein [Belliella kenyensis]|uniref:Probable membrane transporter protein n=1 Tax=Belliella kenyensis TaxID=1472724 RepID=A0ABV8EL31_9BACT|nr:sulfite exporter TauE/SafE family protein [Belliella kenyensis]MCH7400577.1 sulfite exporter TauE/SafE family protein [Belliella kenyensis]MDN3602136.1 sulfite exporter TauE/SafE family protein [Belliella kenyensis]
MDKIILKVKAEPLWALFFLISFLLIILISFKSFAGIMTLEGLDWEMFFWFLLVGFVAQTIDGALGMAYGVTSNSMLLGIGIPPAMASAWVHFAQVFTSLASGFSHWRLGNVNWSLAKRLIIPGVLGAVIGAFFLSNIDSKVIKPVIALYLLVMGIVILKKVFRKKEKTFDAKEKSISYLAGVGGFADAIGGGGWGPIVNSTLLGKGQTPRYAIGTGNFVEIFVSLGSAVTFLFFIKELSLAPVLGLIVGGVIASPFAAIICKKMNAKILMFIVGLLIVFLSIRTFYLTIF